MLLLHDHSLPAPHIFAHLVTVFAVCCSLYFQGCLYSKQPRMIETGLPLEQRQISLLPRIIKVMSPLGHSLDSFLAAPL